MVATRSDRAGRTKKLFTTSNSSVVGNPSALAFGPDGGLYIADSGHRAILRASPSGEIVEMVTVGDRNPLNGPNDLSFDADGSLYFSDPRGSSPRDPIGAVYGFSAVTGEMSKVDDGMEFPNGVVARQGVLYVAETFQRKIWSYDIVGPGRTANKRLFCELPDNPGAPALPRETARELGVDRIVGPDGMAFDIEGNLYVAAYGSGCVWVFDQAGERVGPLKVGDTYPTNVCFGWPDFTTLYVTLERAGEVVAIPTDSHGDRLNFCPSVSPLDEWSRALAALE